MSMNVLNMELGICPICHQGHIIKTNKDYVCTCRLNKSTSHGRCKFSLSHHTHGVYITDDLVKQLVTSGKTSLLTMQERQGLTYEGRFVITHEGNIGIETKRTAIDGKCPDCGSEIVQTKYGYACLNSLLPDPKCKFIIPKFICNRYIKENEASAFVSGKQEILDGFLNKKGTFFSAYLTRNSSGSIVLSSVVGHCPECGGDILVGAKAFNCSNYKQGCTFKIWRHYYGHHLSLQEIKELLQNKQTLNPIVGYTEDARIVELQFKLGIDDQIQVVSYK